MHSMNSLLLVFFFFFFFFLASFSSHSLSLSWSHNSDLLFDQDKNYEGSSDLVDVQYHMGPVLSSPAINLYVIWYGKWKPTHQSTIRDFLYSVSSPAPYPSVADWWRTVRLYTDQTGSNVTGNLVLSGEFHDHRYSHGASLTRLSIQYVIRSAIATTKLPLNGHNGLYLVLTSEDVQMQEFCRAICGFHHFTFPNIVGVTVPYIWVGNSRRQCPEMCAYPFVQPKPPYVTRPEAMKPPNGEAGIEGMISVVAHELAEASSNPFLNGWYAGEEATAPTEIGDLCLGVYGTGGGGGYMGSVYKDKWGDGFNLNGVKGRKFMVQWVWDPFQRRCFGPNALD